LLNTWFIQGRGLWLLLTMISHVFLCSENLQF
jgi:hypothetical protein